MRKSKVVRGREEENIEGKPFLKIGIQFFLEGNVMVYAMGTKAAGQNISYND